MSLQQFITMHLQAQGSAVSGSVLWIVWDNCNIEARLSKNQYSIDLIMLLHLKAHWICSDAGSSTFFPDNMNKKCIYCKRYWRFICLEFICLLVPLTNEEWLKVQFHVSEVGNWYARTKHENRWLPLWTLRILYEWCPSQCNDYDYQN